MPGLSTSNSFRDRCQNGFARSWLGSHDGMSVLCSAALNAADLAVLDRINCGLGACHLWCGHAPGLLRIGHRGLAPLRQPNRYQLFGGVGERDYTSALKALHWRGLGKLRRRTQGGGAPAVTGADHEAAAKAPIRAGGLEAFGTPGASHWAWKNSTNNIPR